MKTLISSGLHAQWTGPYFVGNHGPKDIMMDMTLTLCRDERVIHQRCPRACFVGGQAPKQYNDGYDFDLMQR